MPRETSPIPYALTDVRARLEAMSTEVEQLGHHTIGFARASHPIDASPVDVAALETRMRVENVIRDDARRVRDALAKFGRSLGYLHEIGSSLAAATTDTSGRA